jgi:CoA:oxalate CoA-transferase
VFDDSKYDTQPGRWEDREMINSTLNNLFSSNTCQYWLAQLEAKRIPCAPVNSLSQALSDEQVLHRNMVIDLKHPDGSQTKGPGNPIKLSRTNDEIFTPAPMLGQHTEEVLKELLGYSAKTIEQLKEQGHIK